MTITAFIPFERKPPKGKASSILKQYGFTERAATSTMWVFGLSKFKVEVLDFRDDMVKSDRAEWVDEVGWQHKWAIGVSIHTTRREEQYVQWHVLAASLAWAYGVKEIWLDGATTIPQETFNLEEFFEGISKSDEAEDKMPIQDDMPDMEVTATTAEEQIDYMPTQGVPQVEPNIEPVAEVEPAQVESLVKIEPIDDDGGDDEDADDDDDWGDWDDWDDEDDSEQEPALPLDNLKPVVEEDDDYEFDDDDEDDEDDGLVDSITSW
jgi:hypothetical protein